jgi:hypothetical protein
LGKEFSASKVKEFGAFMYPACLCRAWRLTLMGDADWVPSIAARFEAR